MSKKETKSAEKEVNEGGMEDSPLLSPFHHTRISSYVPLANFHNIQKSVEFDRPGERSPEWDYRS